MSVAPDHDAFAAPAALDLGPSLESIFGAEGRLARNISGWRLRPQQLEMAIEVQAALRETRVLVCEAGTGTGKTLAYMVPALLSGGKVIVSTGTKTLQDQLFHRDLPNARAALSLPVTTALLKGRANYVCHYHLERNIAEGRLPTREDSGYLRAIASFARTTHSGDKAELTEVPENAAAWAYATSTRENCLGQKCGHWDDCFVMKARREAIDADVVVVNHHLFFADIVLRDEGVAELLPACNTVILDEAHQLGDVATLFFGETVSSAQLIDIARDSRVEVASGARDSRELVEAAAAVEKFARDMRIVLGRAPARMPSAVLDGDREFVDVLDDLDAALSDLANGLEALSERSEGLKRVAERSREARERLARWREDRAGPENGSPEDDGGWVRWAEAYVQSVALHATPLSIASIFKRQIDGRPRAWIFTSATLAMGGDFSHFLAELGLEGAKTSRWESPFDYAGHARLFVPRNMPEPSDPKHTEAVIEAALPLIRASGGSAMLLFTTLRALKRANEILREKLAEAYPLLVQGEGSRSELLDRFRRLGNAVLLGSASFWEGIDVRGDALRLLVIDKLPFAPPDDPVLEERLKRIQKKGGNAFMSYQLPQTAIALKQGAGRLIRDDDDRGVLAICDPRLMSKPYGKRLIASLPPMTLVREAQDAVEFLRTTRPAK